MNELQTFNNKQFGQIRTLEIEGEPYCVGTDVAKALGYTNPQKAVRDHCRKDGVTKRSVIDSLGRKQMANFINEGNLYRLIVKSELPEAEKFERWVFDEVLPSIRKTGEYKTPEKKMSDYQKMMTETRTENAKIRKAQILERLAKQYNGTYKQILHAHATKELTGEFLLPLPKMEQKTYSATDIGDLLGISSNKVGRIANEKGLKNKTYGDYFKDKSPHSRKEVETFRYYENVIPVIKSAL